MSNTLDETLDRRLHVLACKLLGLDDEDHEDDEAALELEAALKSLILSEAHKARIDELLNCRDAWHHADDKEFASIMNNRLGELTGSKEQ